MGYAQAIVMANMISLEQEIRWHLQHNHYPPAPIEMIQNAIRAVRLCRKNKFDESIVTFFEHQGFGWSVPAHVIVEAYHLELWVNELKIR